MMLTNILSEKSITAHTHHAFIICAIVGSIVVLNSILTFFKGIFAHLLRPGKNLKKFGSWAVVTGSTDGIGKAMAIEFARKGLNVFLISRSEDKLKQTANEILVKYPKSTVKYLAIDFSNFNSDSRSCVSTALDDLDIGILVNNVGVSYSFARYFDEIDDANVEQLIRLNVDSTTWMTRIVLPGMKSRRRGAIVNIGSAAGVATAPLLAQYGAAKSYIAMFSKALNYEMRSFGVHVQCQVPMFVTTKLAKLKKTSLFVASPSGYARAAVAAIGYEAVTSPYWSHALQIWVSTALPEWIIANISYSMHIPIRKAGMKKEQRLREESKIKDT